MDNFFAFLPSRFSLHILHLMVDLVILCHKDLIVSQESGEQVTKLILMLILMKSISLYGAGAFLDCRLLEFHHERLKVLIVKVLIKDLKMILIIGVGVEDDALRRHGAANTGVRGAGR